MSFRSLWLIICAVVLLLRPAAEAGYTGPTTAAGIALIKNFEGFRPNFYIDPVGIKTIGYGHACHVNNCNQIHPPLSEAQATQLLVQDLQTFENCVRSNVRYSNLNSAQFSALVSFTFNMGCGSLRSSTLLRLLNQGNTLGASKEFKKWVHGGGKVLPGLVRRREAERVLFCSAGGC